MSVGNHSWGPRSVHRAKLEACSLCRVRITAALLALVGGGALAVWLLTGGSSTHPNTVLKPASSPGAVSGSTPSALASKEAAPAQVLDAYLRALKAGDCKAAQALTTSSFALNGELCGHLQVKSNTPVGHPATPGSEAIVPRISSPRAVTVQCRTGFMRVSTA